LIETCGNFVMRVSGAALIATSSELAPLSLAPGERHRVAVDPGRLWQYVAVRGGIEAPEVLGSRSTDTLSGLGPPPLVSGDMIPVGREPGDPVAVDHAPRPDPAGPARVGPGPRLDWFEPACFERLVAAAWVVSDSSRIGVRLRGVTLPRRILIDLPSEGLVRGAIQVPPDSDPLMMLADHPTTGGYPVIAVVHPDDVGTVAHTPPGGTVRFTDHALR
jgi:allophanate hydrolase subunit 2